MIEKFEFFRRISECSNKVIAFAMFIGYYSYKKPFYVDDLSTCVLIGQSG